MMTCCIIFILLYNILQYIKLYDSVLSSVSLGGGRRHRCFFVVFLLAHTNFSCDGGSFIGESNTLRSFSRFTSKAPTHILTGVHG